MAPVTRSSAKRDRSRGDDSETDEDVNFGRSKRRRILSNSSDSERDQETADSETGEEGNSARSSHRRSRRRGGYDLQKRTCNICKRVFIKVAHMRDHMAVHDPNRPKYRCPYPNCDKEYNKVKNWRTHFVKNHTTDQ